MLGFAVSWMRHPQDSHAYAPSSNTTFSHFNTCITSQCGHGTKNRRWSDSFHSCSIRDVPFTDGVDILTSFRFQNVLVRFVASAIGSPLSPADAGYLSISSNSTMRIGLEERPVAEFAPTNVK